MCDLDADNTCKLPFFYDGVWFENCTLTPKDDFWCPTGKNLKYFFIPHNVPFKGVSSYSLSPVF